MSVKITDPGSDFQTKLIQYLETCHQGSFMDATPLDDVKDFVYDATTQEDYKEPTNTLPVPPPDPCKKRKCDGCTECEALQQWRMKYKEVVNGLIFRSNVHDCDTRECKKTGVCKARFPRTIFPKSLADPSTGHIILKHLEPQLNTFTPMFTYLIRSNSDVTSLLSGTALKAVVAYVTDYITKSPLKTHTIFDAVRSIFDKNSELLSGTVDQKEKARKILTQTVNALSAKLEIGGPMAW